MFELVEIEKIDSYEVEQEIVYDLTVEDNHSYCVEDGIVVHNSACSTRIVTGVGYPQLSAIIECADAAHGLKSQIVADGGCRNSGHVVKAIGAGADFVMLGGMLAGTDECEGEWVYLNREIYNYNCQGVNDYHHLERYGMSLDGTTFVPTNDKSLHLSVKSEGQKSKLKFYGMSSEEAMNKFYGGKRDYIASEGVSMEVAYKGSVEKVIQEILGGIRSACTYVGTSRLKDFSKCCTFVRVNRVHDLRK